MAANLGLTEEFDSEIKLTDDKFSLNDQESQQWSVLSKRKLDDSVQSLGGEELNQAQISSDEEPSPLLEVAHSPTLDNTGSAFSSRFNSVGLKSIQQASRGLETTLESRENLLPSQTDVLNAIQNNRSGFGLDTNSGWVGDSPSGLPAQPTQFGCTCPECCDSGAPKFEHLVSDVNQANASASAIIRNVPKSGDIKVDSLFRDAKWSSSKITYSFFDDAKGGPYYSNSYKGVREITDKMKSYLRNILENIIEPLINVDFVEVEDTKNSYGQIRYLFSTTPSVASTTRITGSSATAGDVKFNPKYTKDLELGPGAYRYETLIHETLHALGLKHPGNYNGSSTGGQDGPFLPDNIDHSGNSVLSYNRFRYDTPHNGVITPMTHDIKALQYLYGAKEHEAGDTTYKFDSVFGVTVGGKFFGSQTQGIKQTLWDSGGKDTFDFSGLTSNQSGYHLDLSEGGWITTQDAYMSASYEARGNGKTYKATALGTKTAFGFTVENLVNSTSNDTIIANQAANIFSGYSIGVQTGNDTIINSNGQDQLILAGYKTADVTQTTSGNNLILGLGGNGSITLKDYYAANQTDRIQILFDGTNPIPTPTPTPTPTPIQVSFQAGVNGFNGTVDTYIHTNDSTSYATTPILRVDGQTTSGRVEQVLLRFEDIFGNGVGQIASNAQIKSASLQLDVTNKGDSLALHRMLQTWSDTSTWSSFGDGIQANGIEAASTADLLTGPESVGLHTFDVTASLQAWQANPSSNFGWALLPTGPDGVYFSSSEGTNAPRLVVEFNLPPTSGKNLITGTGADDILQGTDGADLIKALTGNDTLQGFAGKDKLQGGKGNDLLKGGKGKDVLEGGKGDDTLEGGQNDDTLDGGSGDDILLGGSGHDLLTGGSGQDTFVYEAVDHRRDTITDFEIGIDKIDLSGLFKGTAYASANVFNDYVQLEQLGADTKVRVDILGDNGDQFKTMAQLTNIDKTALTADHFVLA